MNIIKEILVFMETKDSFIVEKSEIITKFTTSGARGDVNIIKFHIDMLEEAEFIKKPEAHLREGKDKYLMTLSGYDYLDKLIEKKIDKF